MKRTIVIYYSNNGSNQFLAERVAEKLKCEIEQIKPIPNAHLLLLFGISLGIKNLKNDLSKYDMVILCGPIWMGKFILPLKAFVKKYSNTINELVFISCCGSSFEVKDEKYGHGLVFEEVKGMLNEKCIHCEAFPITLVLPENQKEDSNIIMKTRLNSENFKGEILDRFNGFLEFMYSRIN